MPKDSNKDIIKSMNKQFTEQKIHMGSKREKVLKLTSDSEIKLKLTPRCHFITQTDGN